MHRLCVVGSTDIRSVVGQLGEYHRVAPLNINSLYGEQLSVRPPFFPSPDYFVSGSFTISPW